MSPPGVGSKSSDRWTRVFGFDAVLIIPSDVTRILFHYSSASEDWDFAIAIIFFLHEGCVTTTFITYAGNVNPHTCNVNHHTCNDKHHTCNVNRHSCNLNLIHEIKSAALSIWQNNWDNGETGRSTQDIVPRVSNKPVGWNREEIMFDTGHGLSLHTFIASIFEHMTNARAEKKEIQFTMPQNVGLPSPGIPKLQQCHLNYSG
ncbi:hypothetical protein AVEN_135512-1 [Araneus ventricosus]|uniref:Uncharacterized protein n=1 Tax=Araneus ventricosus TaxID=182803 RepID=A0A4Y2HP11_ARAVE|nr:hypothetical protein AVEN_135512-1 [Araneus ventricosus]